MILPSTYASALLLLIISFLCLGLWINTFKFAGSRWRFELYSIDFAIGAALLAAIAAFTFGTLGSDLAFSDRMLVAGRASQAFAVAAGFLFNLGNMLLLAAVSLLGISGAFPIAFGWALVIGSLFSFRFSNVLILIGGMVLMLLTVFIQIAACRIRDAQRRAAATKPVAAGTASQAAGVPGTAKPAVKSALRTPPKPARRKAGKGIFIALLSGTMLGFFYPLAAKGMSGELSLGPYAGLLLFAVGILVSTVLFDFYFLNIAIEGPRLTSGAYLEGQAHQHFLGFAGGALWAGGALAALLALALPAQAGLQGAIKLILPLASVLLAVACGTFGWKEFKSAPANAKVSLYLASAIFACGLAFIAFAIRS
jgi:glucose uptake protein